MFTLRLRSFTTIGAASAMIVTSTVIAQTPAKTLERAVATYRSATTMRLSFDQTLTNPLTGTSMSGSGELLRKKPNLLSITMSGEAKDRIVADGKSLWIYLPSSAPDQVIKVPAGTKTGALIDPLGQVLTAPAEKFALADAGTATIGSRPTHAVALTPKRGEGALFTKATVWVDDKDGTVRQIETAESSGISRKIIITKYSANQAIPKSAFAFTPPANARVVEGFPGR